MIRPGCGQKQRVTTPGLTPLRLLAKVAGSRMRPSLEPAARARRATRLVAALAVCAAGGIACAPRALPALAGRWDATVVVDGVEIPCAFEIAGSGEAMTGAFFNGPLRIVSTGTRIDDDVVTFAYDQYGTKLRVSVRNGQLDGEYVRSRGPYPFRARRAAARPPAAGPIPAIDGVWLVKARGSKSESAWRFIVQQTGADAEATVLRIDGDTGALTGRFADGRFLLSHFDGSRPLLMAVSANPDGTLTLVENGTTESIAAREGTEAARAVGRPEDPTAHTSVRDAGEPFRFSFPDLDGRIVSSTDPQFAGKVLLVSVGGSWCPNCHDEAPFLASLYRQYRGRGLEVVSLSFERADQLKNPVQLRAFVKTYGIEYTVLIPGEPDRASDLLPQAANLDCFPTSFILDREGRVRMVHAGFPSPGSGAFYDEAVRAITGTVERLLDEDTADAAASPDVRPATAAAAAGQDQSGPPRLTLQPAVASPATAGSTVRLTLKVTMPAAYHVQAHEPRDPALIPTVLDVSASDGVSVGEVRYPKAQELRLAGSSDVLLVYGPTFTIEATLRLAPDVAAGDLAVPAVLRYQACNDRVCFAPSRARGAWTLHVERPR
jgi:thiol-disulfide isomerase/thioredoxin